MRRRAAGATPPVLHAASCAHVVTRCACDTPPRARVVSPAATAQGRDAGGLVGGWAGGEKELKDWAAVPFSPIDPALRKAMNDFSDKKEVCRAGCRACAHSHACMLAPQADGSDREGIYGAYSRAPSDALLACAGARKRPALLDTGDVVWRRRLAPISR